MSDAPLQPTPETAEHQAPNLNIANVLTVIRLVLVPVFIWLMWVDTEPSRLGAFVVFIVASLTDKLDGTLARKLNLVTNFGKLADPIADKALVLSAFVMLAIQINLWWFWAVTIIVLVRELGITVMRLFLVRRGFVMPANWWGKWKTVSQMACIIWILLPWEMTNHYLFQQWGSDFRDGSIGVTIFLMVLVVILTVMSGLVYVVEAIKFSGGAASESVNGTASGTKAE